MQRVAGKNVGALVLAPDRRQKMLVRRQGRDRESIAALARNGTGEGCSSEVKAAQAKPAPATVGAATEKRGNPMDAQARMLDDDSFESRWRARVSTE